MKLFYAPSACSMAPHIVSREAGIKVDLVKVDIPNKKTEAGDDYWKVNFKGYVPTLQLDNGEVLTEVGVICQYLSDQKPESGLAPKPGTMERYRLMEWLNFVAAEMHKQFGALFNPKYTPEMREVHERRAHSVLTGTARARAMPDERALHGFRAACARAGPARRRRRGERSARTPRRSRPARW